MGNAATARVLVVDDEPQILAALEDLLEDEFEIFTAGSARVALALLREHRVSVIISDQRMPDVNGDAFLAEARGLSAATRILITGYADLSAVVRAVNDGQIYGYVSKPWDPEHLQILVTRACEHFALLEELREERELLNHLLDNVPDWIAFKDRERRFLRVNPTVARHLGLSDPALAIGRRADELSELEQTLDVVEEDARIIERGEAVISAERKIRLTGGEEHWFSVTKVPMRDPVGRVRGLVTVGRDIDDRRAAHARLHESELRFREFAETASDWLWETDAEHRFTFISERHEVLSGIDPSAVIGRTHREILQRPGSDEHLVPIEAALAAREAFSDASYPIEEPDGSLLWTNVSGRPRFDVEGNFLGYRGTGRDVTAQIESMRMLREREADIRLLLDSTAEAIYGTDVDGRCTFANAACARLLGAERTMGLVGRDMHELTHHHRADGTPIPIQECRIHRSLRSANAVHVDDEVLWRLDGTSFPAEYRAHPLLEDDAVRGAVVTFVDITERKRNAAAIAVVDRIAVELSEVADIRSALTKTIELVCEAFGWRVGEAWLPSEDGRRLELAAISHPSDPALDLLVEATRCATFVPSQSLPGRVWAGHSCEWLPNPGRVPRSAFDRRDAIHGTGLKGVCGVPVIASGEVIGVLVFYTVDASEEASLRLDALSAAVAPLSAFLHRIAAEDALRQADERLNVALEASRIGTWSWIADPDVLHWDDYVGPLFGLAPGEAPADQEAFEALIHPDDRAAVHRTVAKRNLTDQGRIDTEYRVVWPSDGSVHHIAMRGRVHLDSTGALARLTGVCWDITEEKHREAERESLARFHLENPHPVLRIGADGRVETANAASHPILAHWGSGIGAPVPGQVARLVARVLASGEVTAYEAECGERIVRLSLVPLAEHGYVNAYGEDVTAERHAAERLRQVQKMEAVGQLTGGIAHDFNNRLTVIIGNLELLQLRTNEDEKAARLLARALKAAEGSARLTHQLLTFSRRGLEEPSRVDVNARVQALADMIDQTLGDAIDLQLRLNATWPVRTDPGQLEDALLNLTVNARDAMPGDGALAIETADVTIGAGDVQPRPYIIPGEYVLIALTDTGTGIPPDVVERIFEPFFTTKPTGKGTGLGMSMVYGFVKQSGGHVNVYTEMGVGTCVRLYLPRHVTEGGSRLGAEAATTRASPTNRLRILVVEDNVEVRELATDLIEDLGHRYAEVDTATAALETLERDPTFDLVFSDVVMPGGMSGVQLAEAIRERWPGLPILLTSGYTEQGPFREAVARHELPLLVKPYTRARLAEKLADLVSYAEATRPAPDSGLHAGSASPATSSAAMDPPAPRESSRQRRAASNGK